MQELLITKLDTDEPNMSPKYFVLLTTATCAVFAGLTPVTADARGRRAVIDDPFGGWQNEITLTLNTVASQNSGAISLPGGMSLKVGNVEYKFIKVNENGFISLAETANDIPTNFAAGISTIQGLTGNVIAGFYADVKTRSALDMGCPASADAFDLKQFTCDVSYAKLDIVIDPDFPPQPLPSYLNAIRVSWGLFGTESTEIPPPPPGVPHDQGTQTDETLRNTFQLQLIDRSKAAGNQPGDFDIEFNYNRIAWEARPTLIGFKLGPYSLDFAEFYKTFVGGYSDADCPQAPNGGVPGFGPHIAPNFACNAITVAFRNGEPNLLSYTSDLSLTLSRSTTGVINANETFGLALDIGNAKHDTATNVTSVVTLPAGSTFVSATPGTTCVQANTELRCSHGSLAVGSPLKPVLTLRSSVAGALAYSAVVDADQYDPKPAGNAASLQVTVAPVADVSISSCDNTASVVRGTSVALTCTIRNDGPQAATAVTVSAQLPAAIALQSGAGCSVAAGVLTCSLGSLASNATASLSVTLNTLTSGSTDISASVRADQHDPAPNNNTRTASFAIADPPQAVVQPSGGGGGGGGSIPLSMSILLMLLLFARQALGRLRLAHSIEHPGETLRNGRLP